MLTMLTRIPDQNESFEIRLHALRLHRKKLKKSFLSFFLCKTLKYHFLLFNCTKSPGIVVFLKIFKYDKFTTDSSVEYILMLSLSALRELFKKSICENINQISC